MENELFMQGGGMTMPDEALREACAGYCWLAMKQMGVSQDAMDCIVDSLWEVYDSVSVEAARSAWRLRRAK